jgi:hypothetical protein
MIHPGACWRVRFQDAVPGRWASIRADDPVRGRCERQRERVLDGLLGGETSSEFAVAAGGSITTVSCTMRRLRDTVVELGYRKSVTGPRLSV